MTDGQQPQSLLTDEAVVPSRTESLALAHRVLGFARDGGPMAVTILGGWRNDIRWARNRVMTAGTGAWITVQITCDGAFGSGQTWTNQLDDASLRAAVALAERYRRLQRGERRDAPIAWVAQRYVLPQSWAPATVAVDAARGSAAVRTMTEPAEQAGCLGAGFLEATAATYALVRNNGLEAYDRHTESSCSTTIRDPARNASGWSGVTTTDWSAIDVKALASRAVDKAIRSRDPVAVEPGRYTAILEPQATADLLVWLIGGDTLDRFSAENGDGPFAGARGSSKLGLRVADPRVTIGQDPMRDRGMIPFDSAGNAVRPTTWIDRGILVNLGYIRDYALETLNEDEACPIGNGFTMTGGDASVDEMIRTTERGVLVTRFSNITLLDRNSRLVSGTTRDGLWLVQRGQIVKPIKNFRFMDSPVFVLNKLDRIGTSVPVHHQDGPITVPSLQVRDFNFSSLSDSI